MKPFTKRQKNSEYIKQRRVDRRKYALQVLGNKCRECGETEKQKLHIHHIDKSKKEINTKEFGNVSWERFTKEIDKCELLCYTCHTILHNKEKFGCEDIDEDEWNNIIQPLRK